MKSNLITRTGHDLLVAELKKLWHDERPEITKKVNWAASLGDRSENADSFNIAPFSILFKKYYFIYNNLLIVCVLCQYTILNSGYCKNERRET